MRNISTPPELIDRRRALVAGMVVKGASIREMTKILAARGEVNPITQEPWNHATIGRDVIALREAWKQEASRTILDHKARLLAEINAVKIDAWKIHDHRVILESIRSERQLLGLDSPMRVETKTELTSHVMSDDELARQMYEVLVGRQPEIIEAPKVFGESIEALPELPENLQQQAAAT